MAFIRVYYDGWKVAVDVDEVDTPEEALKGLEDMGIGENEIYCLIKAPAKLWYWNTETQTLEEYGHD